MKTIKLTQGKVALVDDEDFEEFSKFKWLAGRDGNTYYALRTRYANGHKHTIRMHRVIMSTPDGMLTDHIDGNGLNNQRSNLRICTTTENSRNVRKHVDNISGFKGVTFHTRDKKWRAQITVNSKVRHLGYYDTKELAYQAYCDACVKYHGDFARVT